MNDIDKYINLYSGDIKDRLINIRKTILSVDSSLIEKISYQMPTYWKNKNIIHFAVNKNHIGIYPTPKAIEHFKTELSSYKTSKGAIQFPNDKPIPYDLIKQIVEYNLT